MGMSMNLNTEYENAGMFERQIDAQKLWFALLTAQIETGTPYMLYKDAINRKSNQKNLGTIKSSNLCVAPETKILTSKGQVSISDLEDKEVNVWNGEDFSKTIVRKTGEKQKLITVTTSQGTSLRCTPYHKFWIHGKKEPVRAHELKPDMKLIKHNLPTIKGQGEMKYAYTHGFFCSDGTTSNHSEEKRCSYKAKMNGMCMRHQNNNSDYPDDGTCRSNSYSEQKWLDLYHEKQELIKHIDYDYSSVNIENNRTRCHLPKDLDEKFFVPINYSLSTKLEWLSGLLDGDGCVISHSGGRGKSIQIASIHKEFLTDVMLMLQTLGITSRINKMRDEAFITSLNGLKNNCKPLYRLLIASGGVEHLKNIGFSPKRLDLNVERLPQRQALHFFTITSVEDKGETDDTYCFNEPIKHRGIFNGMITGNCTEIVQYTSPTEVAVCNLASISLPSYVKTNETGEKYFDFEDLRKSSGILTRNLNKVIDKTFYPIQEAENSNIKHRPIGIGVQGLADVYMIFDIPFDSDEADQLNGNIFETIYYGALEMSNILAINDGSYETFDDSPISKGKFQFDLWDEDPMKRPGRVVSWDWETLREKVVKSGIRNSLLLAPMPTASTAQILGNNECFEPYTSNIYLRRTLAGEFIVINKHLVSKLESMGLWNKEMKNKIIEHNGSVQNIKNIPDDVKKIYKTVWELSMKSVIQQSATRGPYVCQSQSLNMFVASPTFSKLSSMHFYGWKKGLKTGMYYLRTKPAADAIQFTIEPETCENCSG